MRDVERGGKKETRVGEMAAVVVVVRREAGFGGFPTPARALGSRCGKYLPLRGRLASCQRPGLPVVRFEVVELIELETDVLNGELQQVPETSQVLGTGPWVGTHILDTGGRRQTMWKPERTQI